MASKTRFGNSSIKSKKNDFAIISFHSVCPRCENRALVKTAAKANNYSNESVEKIIQTCSLCVITCPHCGFWTHTGYVHKSRKAIIEYLKSLGFFEHPADGRPDYVAMSITLYANGSCVMVRKDGSMEFFRYGGKPGQFTDERVKYLLANLEIADTLDKERTYLSRWNKEEKRLEIFCGSVPEFSFHSEEADEWENKLTKPNFADKKTAEEFDKLIRVLYFNKKEHISRSIKKL